MTATRQMLKQPYTKMSVTRGKKDWRKGNSGIKVDRDIRGIKVVPVNGRVYMLKCHCGSKVFNHKTQTCIKCNKPTGYEV